LIKIDRLNWSVRPKFLFVTGS